MTKHKIRCLEVKDFHKIFTKMMSEEVKKAPVDTEELSKRILKKLGVSDPAMKFELKR